MALLDLKQPANFLTRDGLHFSGAFDVATIQKILNPGTAIASQEVKVRAKGAGSFRSLTPRLKIVACRSLRAAGQAEAPIPKKRKAATLKGGATKEQIQFKNAGRRPAVQRKERSAIALSVVRRARPRQRPTAAARLLRFRVRYTHQKCAGTPAFAPAHIRCLLQTHARFWRFTM
jgi:hypothetical protein